VDGALERVALKGLAVEGDLGDALVVEAWGVRDGEC
jgi:hypothetical protein